MNSKSNLKKAYQFLILILMAGGIISCAALKEKVDHESLVKKTEIELVGLTLKTTSVEYSVKYVNGEPSDTKDLKINTGAAIKAVLSGDLRKLFEKMVIDIDMRIFNPNQFTLKVNHFTADVIMQGKKITVVSYNKEIVIASNADAIHKLSFAIPSNVDIKTILTSDEITLKGNANMSLVVSDVTTPGVDVPIDITKPLQMQQVRDALKENNIDLNSL